VTAPRYHQITTADLTALLDCRTALADLVHVLDSEPEAGFGSAELRDGYDDWLERTRAHAHAALDAAALSLSGLAESTRSALATPAATPRSETGASGDGDAAPPTVVIDPADTAGQPSTVAYWKPHNWGGYAAQTPTVSIEGSGDKPHGRLRLVPSTGGGQ